MNKQGREVKVFGSGEDLPLRYRWTSRGKERLCDIDKDMKIRGGARELGQ